MKRLKLKIHSESKKTIELSEISILIFSKSIYFHHIFMGLFS
jgi:hypothetical protein